MNLKRIERYTRKLNKLYAWQDYIKLCLECSSGLLFPIYSAEIYTKELEDINNEIHALCVKINNELFI